MKIIFPALNTVHTICELESRSALDALRIEVALWLGTAQWEFDNRDRHAEIWQEKRVPQTEQKVLVDTEIGRLSQLSQAAFRPG